ncbi:YdbH family protein [Siccibacter colletis]|uniref:YdbH family protein n=1 Tax=Siccibacter colletis TaxID=1505757 RepID=UPI0004E17593|nr:YdbH family protein [Siccibacter colletis]
MTGKYKAIIATALLIVLSLLALLHTTAYWLPGFAGLWLPKGTRIALESSPRLTRNAIVIPDLRYLAGECELARVDNAILRHPSRWQLDVDTLTLNSACLSQLPESDTAASAPRTLAQWQAMLPRSFLNVNHFSLAPWDQYAGTLSVALSPETQQLSFQGERLRVKVAVKGQTLTLSQFELPLFDGEPPLALAGDLTLGLMPDGLPTQGSLRTSLHLPREPRDATAELEWDANRGQLIVMAPDAEDPLLDLPWTASAGALTISDGRWSWPYQGFPLSGRVAARARNWQQGLEHTLFDGRLNVVTQGRAGKGNAVLNFGPGRLSLTDSAMPLRLTGEAKQEAMIFYAGLPGELSGPLLTPTLRFHPGALLRSRGRVIDALNIDEIRWPLAGVTLTQDGVAGRLQAILRAHEGGTGDFTLHLDGQASNFLPDKGLWNWRYWGEGNFTPMQAAWDVAGRGRWQDSTIELTALSTGLDQLQYGSMTMTTPRLTLAEPLRWVRDPAAPSFTGDLRLNAGETRFSGGSVLPPSAFTFALKGSDPTSFNFRGDLRAGAIGPVRHHGRWDGERLRGEAWWPKQQLTVFQPLIPPDWEMALRDGSLYAQVAFSAAAGQGFEAGGHGVLRDGSAWMPDNKIDGVDFVLPFRFSAGTWHLGTRGPVRLKIGTIENQIVAHNFTASLQGWYPWSEAQPLGLSDVSVEALGGTITMQQLRMPQHDAALVRVNNISTSELVSAVNPKQFTLSGPVSGALPLWLEHPQWIIKDGWLANPGPMTLRLDKDTADAIANDNVAAGAAINWLRYMEISRSWTRIDLDNLGALRLQASITGTGKVQGKSSTVHLNYSHEENLFTLWRSLRFGDNLQSWLEQNLSSQPSSCAAPGAVCEENK